jgi:4'-phosphopantetheinyl transferase
MLGETLHMPFRSDVNQGPLLRLDGILPDDEVHVWHIELEPWEQAIDPLYETLNAEERERASRFKFPAPQNQFVISRALLRQALGRYLHIEARDIRFSTTANGKPELSGNAELQFNLSHTTGVTAIAITRDRRVGIDVERIKAKTEALELADRFFSPREVQWLRSQPATELIPSFFSCWTAKEAYIKAHGQGLSMPLSGFSVLPRSGSSRLHLEVNSDPDESGRWSMFRLDLGLGLRAALAVEGEGGKVRLAQWPQPDKAQ